MNARILLLLALLAPCVLTVSVWAQGNAPGSPGNGKANGNGNASAAASAPRPHTPSPNASPRATEINAVLQKFDAARDQYVAERQALLDKLAAAKTDADRQAVLAELKAEQQSIQDQQRATAKEMRAELQALRRQHGGS